MHYDIGYKKPPKHTQFAKGVSGNPKGCPKKSASTPSVKELSARVQKILGEFVEFHDEAGCVRSASTLEIIIRRIKHEAVAAKENVPAAKALFKLLKYTDEHPRQKPIYYIIGEPPGRSSGG